jgi:hypothetical protein
LKGLLGEISVGQIDRFIDSLLVCVVLREPVANKIKYLSNKSSDQNDQSKSK